MSKIYKNKRKNTKNICKKKMQKILEKQILLCYNKNVENCNVKTNNSTLKFKNIYLPKQSK